jgi:hypothetical protein
MPYVVKHFFRNVRAANEDAHDETVIAEWSAAGEWASTGEAETQPGSLFLPLVNR